MVKTKISQSQRENQSCGIVKDVFFTLFDIRLGFTGREEFF